MLELTMLLDAVRRNDRILLGALTENEACCRDGYGRTLLMHAVLADDADPTLVELLVERGADVDAVDHARRQTALHMAAFLSRPTLVQVLLDAGARVDPRDLDGRTPLWESVLQASDDLTVVRELVAYGADAHCANRRGVSPSDLALTLGHDGVFNLFAAAGG